jgi:hypothetical protein
MKEINSWAVYEQRKLHLVADRKKILLNAAVSIPKGSFSLSHIKITYFLHVNGF